MKPKNLMCVALRAQSAALFAMVSAVVGVGLLAFALASPARAQGAKPAPAASAAPSPAELPLVDGEVRKIDLAQGKLTLKHGPIPNLEMGAMTMVFRVARPALLEGLQVGSKLRFSVERVQGQLTVTAIQPVQP